MSSKTRTAFKTVTANLQVTAKQSRDVKNAIKTIRKYTPPPVKRIKWSEDNKDTLRRLIGEGLTFAKIAESMGMREDQISGAVRRFRMQQKDGNRPWTPEEDALLKEKWENETITAKRLGILLNRSEGAVSRRTQALSLIKFYTVNEPVVRTRYGEERLMILIPGESKERVYLPYLWAQHNGRRMPKGYTVIPRDGKWLDPTPELLMLIPGTGIYKSKVMRLLREGKDPLLEMDREKAELAAATAAQQLQVIQDRRAKEEEAARRKLNLEKAKNTKIPKESSRPRQVVRKSDPVRKSKPAGRPDPRELAHVREGSKTLRYIRVDDLPERLKQMPGAVVEYLPLHGQGAKESAKHYGQLYPKAQIVIL